jgi:hypothetical protein
VGESIVVCRRIVILFFLALSVWPGCHSTSPLLQPTKTISETVHVPRTVERLAVIYPSSAERVVMHAYSVLEGAAFQLKELRPSLQIVDRSDLQSILLEQRLQLEGGVSDDTAIRVGKLLGVDSVLLYRVEGPTAREQALAMFHRDVPPLLVTSKIIMVESAEVVFHNVVTSPVEHAAEEGVMFAKNQSYLRAAMERGIAQTILDLQQAFR